MHLILCGLALLAAILNLALFFQEKKRSEKRRAALIDLIREECGDTARFAGDERRKIQEDLLHEIRALESAADERLRALEAGLIPDYSKAVEAVEEVNKFNEGLSNLLGFDPLASMKKARNSTGGDR